MVCVLIPFAMQKLNWPPRVPLELCARVFIKTAKRHNLRVSSLRERQFGESFGDYVGWGREGCFERAQSAHSTPRLALRASPL